MNETNENCLERRRCPACQQADRFHVWASAAEMEVTDEGAVLYGDVEYEDDSFVRCPLCDWSGKWAQTEVEYDPEQDAAEERAGRRAVLQANRDLLDDLAGRIAAGFCCALDMPREADKLYSNLPASSKGIIERSYLIAARMIFVRESIFRKLDLWGDEDFQQSEVQGLTRFAGDLAKFREEEIPDLII